MSLEKCRILILFENTSLLRPLLISFEKPGFLAWHFLFKNVLLPHGSIDLIIKTLFSRMDLISLEVCAIAAYPGTLMLYFFL
jgi:hypothetical protein